MFRFILLALCALSASAFTAPVASRAVVGAPRTAADATMMAAKRPAKKGGVNPALFATGIDKKSTTNRGTGRKPLKGDAMSFGVRSDGSRKFPKPWEIATKNNNVAERKRSLAASFGSKDGRGGAFNGLFNIKGGRSK